MEIPSRCSSFSFRIHIRICICTIPKAFTRRGALYPPRIHWLTTTLQASLREDALQTDGYQLLITSPDSETILIYVRYMPDVNRRVMNLSIDTARKVIQITAKSYGWDKWVKIREDIQLGESGGR